MCSPNDIAILAYISKAVNRTVVGLSLISGLLISLFSGFLLSLASEGAFAEVDVHPRRVVVWEKFGADLEVMNITISRIDRQGHDGEGSWVYEWELVGDHYSDVARQLESKQESQSAKNAYLTAAVYYAIAKFPENSTPAQRKVYQKHLDSYQDAGKYFEAPLKIVRIAMDDHHITAYLHLPKGVSKPPLVLWANGMDTHKAEIRNLISPLLRKGIAVATFDVPGTGESMEWTGLPTVELHEKLFDHFSNSDLVDGDNIATVGVSFAGNYSSRWAATNSELKSAVILCGVTHDPFTWSADKFAAIPRDVANTMAQVMGVAHGDWEALEKKSRDYDIFRGESFGESTRIKIPVLLINGDKDVLAPIADLNRYTQFADDADVWILGGDGHCAPFYLDTFLPKMADWIAENFD